MYLQCLEFQVILLWITGSHACIFANFIMYKNHYQLNLYPSSSDCTQFAITDKHQDAIEPSAAKSHTINHYLVCCVISLAYTQTQTLLYQMRQSFHLIVIFLGFLLF